MSEVSGSSSYGYELLSANLAKSAQKMQGETVLKLLEGSASTAQAVTASSPQGNLGSVINVRV